MDHPLFTLFFDVTANDGWNLCALCVWALIAGTVAGFVWSWVDSKIND